MKLCKKKSSTIVNSDVLKLVTIIFSKMLFLFIISSLILPHPVDRKIGHRVGTGLKWLVYCTDDGYYCCVVDRHYLFLLCRVVLCTVCKL